MKNSLPKVKAPRQAFADAVLELGKRNKDIVVLTADLAESTRSLEFGKKYPERFFEIGVAEANMVGIASGLALEGKIPFVTTYAVFCPGRSYDQIRQSVCYNDANVKICSSHAGLSVGPDGATHQMLEDIALMRVLPNMTVIAPADYEETKKAVKSAVKIKGPVYIRYTRTDLPVISKASDKFEIGKAKVLKTGKKSTIIACGSMVYESLEAAKKLEKEGISVGVINMHTIKPIDKAAIIKAAKQSGNIITVEDHQVAGGLGSAVSEVLAQNYPVPIEFIGMPDSFGESGEPDELLKKYKMKSVDIIKSVKKLIKK